MIETVPLTPAVVRVLRTFADGAFEMPTMSRVAATVGIPSRISDVRRTWRAIDGLFGADETTPDGPETA